MDMEPGSSVPSNAGRELPDADGAIFAEHQHINSLRPKGRAKADNTRDVADQQSAGDYLKNGSFDTIGLSLSGGGIRSAAFCAGAMQGLAKHGVMEKVDYLSTVSGGGYIGATVSLNMTAEASSFPLLETGGEKKDTAGMKIVRAGANYLQAGQLVPMLKNLSIYLRGLTASFMIIGWVVLVLAGITLLSNPDFASLSRPDLFGLALPKFIVDMGAFGLSSLSLLLLAVFFGAWAIIQSLAPTMRAGLNGYAVWLAAALLLIVPVVLFFELQPFLVAKMIGPPLKAPAGYCPSSELFAQCLLPDGSLAAKGSSCAQDRLVYSCQLPVSKDNGLPVALQNILDWLKFMLAPLVAAVTFAAPKLADFFKTDSGESSWSAFLRRNMNRLLVWAAGLSLPVLIWLAYLYLVYWGVELPKDQSFAERNVPSVLAFAQGIFQRLHSSATPGMSCLVSGMILFLLTLFLDGNKNSLHRLYRDRLADSFAFEVGGDVKKDRRAAKLTELATRRPFHIINAAINVPRSPEVTRSGRKADFFVFTPLHVGSVATGYARTADMEKDKRWAAMDVFTAVAISGAAASSNMGSQSIRPLRFALSLLNVRLGYWFPNPKLLLGGMVVPSQWYFLQEALGLMNEQTDLVYLSDGGHIENLGIYELLRRRCKLVIAVDAEADKDLSFFSFATLQRYARIDLGARIELPWSKIAAKEGERVHCAIGKIEYDNGGEGILVYIKSSLTGDENDYIAAYKKGHADFPHESTSDQFFSEEQFEVYRALGFHAADGLFSGKHKVQTTYKDIESVTDPRAQGYGVRQLARMLALGGGQARRKVRTSRR
jgi:hypothetical protein